jgi:hypothetical protein
MKVGDELHGNKIPLGWKPSALAFQLSFRSKVIIISTLFHHAGRFFRCPGKKTGAEDKKGPGETFLILPSLIPQRDAEAKRSVG